MIFTTLRELLARSWNILMNIWVLCGSQGKEQAEAAGGGAVSHFQRHCGDKRLRANGVGSDGLSIENPFCAACMYWGEFGIARAQKWLSEPVVETLWNTRQKQLNRHRVS